MKKKALLEVSQASTTVKLRTLLIRMHNKQIISNIKKKEMYWMVFSRENLLKNRLRNSQVVNLKLETQIYLGTSLILIRNNMPNKRYPNKKLHLRKLANQVYSDLVKHQLIPHKWHQVYLETNQLNWRSNSRVYLAIKTAKPHQL